MIAWVRIRLAGTGRRRRQLLLIESGAGIKQAQVGPQIVPEEGDERNVTLLQSMRAGAAAAPESPLHPACSRREK